MGKYNLDSVRDSYKGRGQIHLELVSDKWRTEKLPFCHYFGQKTQTKTNVDREVRAACAMLLLKVNMVLNVHRNHKAY